MSCPNAIFKALAISRSSFWYEINMPSAVMTNLAERGDCYAVRACDSLGYRYVLPPSVGRTFTTDASALMRSRSSPSGEEWNGCWLDSRRHFKVTIWLSDSGSKNRASRFWLNKHTSRISQSHVLANRRSNPRGGSQGPTQKGSLSWTIPALAVSGIITYQDT